MLLAQKLEIGEQASCFCLFYFFFCFLVYHLINKWLTSFRYRIDQNSASNQMGEKIFNTCPFQYVQLSYKLY